MIIFGIHWHPYRSFLPSDLTCFNCKEKGRTSVSQISQVFHIFYLPILAFGHGHETRCTHCKVSLKSSEMDREFKTDHQAYLQKNFPPIWHFLGAILIALLLLITWVNRMEKKNEVRERILHVEEGRIFDFVRNHGAYSTFKAAKVEGDSVLLVYNIYNVDRESSLPQIKEEKNYAGDRQMVHRDQLLKWFDDGIIFHVHW